MKKFLKMVVALLTMLTMANCSGDDSAVEPETVVTPEPTTPTVYRLEVEAQLDPLAAESRRQLTRALELSGDVLNKTWGASDKVKVYLGSAWSFASGELTPASSGGRSTKLSGDITFNGAMGNLSGAELHFVFPGEKTEWIYTGQDGTLAKLATDYDYATGASTVKVFDGTTIITANPVTLSNEQAIVKFVLKNSSGNDNLKVKYLTISAAGNQLVQTKGAFLNHPSNTSTYGPITVVPSSATNELWVALRNEKTDPAADKYVLTATDGSGNDYRFSKSDITFENGKAYEVEVNMKSVNYSGDISQPLTLEAVAAGTVSVTQFIDGTDLEYSSDKVNWYQKGTNGISINLDPGQKLYLRGTNSTLGEAGTGSGSYMHIVCTADCYIYGNIMSLVDKTSFSSKTTYDGTFYSLFSDNTHLKNHGTRNLILPITTLPANCYNKTFYGCTGLTRIVCLATDISAAGCVTEWFSGVTTTGTFYRASGASSIWSTATNVPSKWTIEEYKQ